MGLYHLNGRTYVYEGSKRPEVKVCANGAVQFDGKTVKPRPAPQPTSQQNGARQ